MTINNYSEDGNGSNMDKIENVKYMFVCLMAGNLVMARFMLSEIYKVCLAKWRPGT